MDSEGRPEIKVPLNQGWVYQIVSFSVAQSGQKVAWNWIWAPGESLWFWLKEQEREFSKRMREFSFLFSGFLLVGELRREAQEPEGTEDTEERKESGEVTW